MKNTIRKKIADEIKSEWFQAGGETERSFSCFDGTLILNGESRHFIVKEKSEKLEEEEISQIGEFADSNSVIIIRRWKYKRYSFSEYNELEECSPFVRGALSSCIKVLFDWLSV